MHVPVHTYVHILILLTAITIRVTHPSTKQNKKLQKNRNVAIICINRAKNEHVKFEQSTDTIYPYHQVKVILLNVQIKVILQPLFLQYSKYENKCTLTSLNIHDTYVHVGTQVYVQPCFPSKMLYMYVRTQYTKDNQYSQTTYLSA